jgi:hypothetical protein
MTLESNLLLWRILLYGVPVLSLCFVGVANFKIEALKSQREGLSKVSGDTAVSNHQSGGVTANTVNIGQVSVQLTPEQLGMILAQKGISVKEEVAAYFEKLERTPQSQPAPAPPQSLGPWKYFDPVALTQEFQFGWSLFFVANKQLHVSSFKPFEFSGPSPVVDVQMLKLNDDDPSKPVFEFQVVTPTNVLIKDSAQLYLPDGSPAEIIFMSLGGKSEVSLRAVRSGSEWMYGVIGVRLAKNPKPRFFNLQ